jgi:hypothetical protein
VFHLKASAQPSLFVIHAAKPGYSIGLNILFVIAVCKFMGDKIDSFGQRHPAGALLIIAPYFPYGCPSKV